MASTVAHFMSGVTLFYRGELVAARAALDKPDAEFEAQKSRLLSS